MRIAYFTGGTAGAGHLVRGIAIGRALERAGYAGEFRMFIPSEPLAGLRTSLVPYAPVVCACDADEVLDPVRGQASKLARRLVDYSPDLVIADLFWAPLRHILPILRCEAWLIVRACPPGWLYGTSNVRFEPTQYSRVIAIEPMEHEAIREQIEPVVVCNPDEAKTRDDVCARWRIEPNARIVAIAHAGLEGEINTIDVDPESDGDTFVLRSDLHRADAVFPFAIWLPSVDQVTCFAGYNSYWESRWMSYAHKTRLHVVGREIDNPLARVRAGNAYTMRENGADVLARSIAG